MPASSKTRGSGAALPAILVALLLGAGTAGSEAGTEPVLEERVSTRLVRVPVVLRERRPGGCQDLADGSIQVTEDGLHVGPTYVEPDSLDTIHAILVDAGPRMLESIYETGRAASTYVRSLPHDEPALLATFDHRLLLHAPSSTDRERFEASAAWIEIGADSSLWASTGKLIEYLRPRLARKALILVTHGCDTQGGVGAEDVMAAAERVEALSVFPIVIDAPAGCDSTGTDARPALLKLAARTGGELFHAGSAASLDRLFRAIGARLRQETYVLYEPPPFGQGPQDKLAQRTSRWRRLHATLGGAACSVTLAGAPTRCESAPGSGDCVTCSSGSNRLLRPFGLSPVRDSLNARVLDVIHDRGTIAPSLDALRLTWLGSRHGRGTRHGRPRLSEPSPGRLVWPEEQRARDVSAYVPPIEDLLRAPGVEGVVQHLLARTDAAAAGAPTEPLSGRWFDEPLLVNGDVLLDLRGPWSQALASRDDYRAWATQRARAERLAAFDALIRNAGTEDRRGLLERARAGMSESPPTLDACETLEFLGAWLGDVPAAHAFQIGETLLARQLLAAVRTGGPQHLASAWNDTEQAWARLRRRVPPPDELRMLGWLVPGYDPDQRVVGTYRVVLARPFGAELKDRLFGAVDANSLKMTGVSDPRSESALFDHLQGFNFSREAPLGARLLRWMLAQDEVLELLQAGFDVEAVRYAHATPRDLGPAMRRSGVPGLPLTGGQRLARQVTLVLRSPATSGPGLPIGGYFALRDGSSAYDDEPVCLALYPERVETEAQAALLRSLAAAERSTPCLL